MAFPRGASVVLRSRPEGRVGYVLAAWRWKDEDEFAWAVEVGKLSDSEAAAIRAEGERVVRLLEDRAWPFSADWGRWAPDPAWSVPSMPDNWSVDTP